MKIKKALAITIAAVSVLSFAACGGGGNATAKSTDTAAKSGSTASSDVTTVQPGILTMATHTGFPPYEYYDGDNIVGIDADIAAAIADELGLKLEIQDMDFSSVLTSVQTGKADIGASGLTVTEERKKNVNFTTSYATGVQVIIVPEDSAIASKDDLEGALIGCQEGTTGWFYCTSDYGDDAVVAYTNGATAIQAMTDGKVDCVVIDKQPALEFVKATKGLKILDTEYITEDYAIAMNKDNEALLDAVNGALDKMIKDGKVQEILDKYIKAE